MIKDVPLEVFTENEKLIRYIANRFYNLDDDDLYQAGCLGLSKAYQNYVSSSTNKFSTYAYSWIFGEMFALMQKESTITLNKEYIRIYKQIQTLQSNYYQNMGRFPSMLEIANELNEKPEFISEVIIISQNVKSIYEEYEDLTLGETIADKPRDLLSEILLKDAIDNLPSPEKEIIMMKYFGDLSQQEIARKLSLSQAKVSRYEKRGKDQIGEYLSAA